MAYTTLDRLCAVFLYNLKVRVSVVFNLYPTLTLIMRICAECNRIRHNDDAMTQQVITSVSKAVVAALIS